MYKIKINTHECYSNIKVEITLQNINDNKTEIQK